VTERVVADRALRESEAKLRLVIESLKDVIWTLDAETLQFLYVSPSVERLRGFTPEEVKAAPLDAALPPDAAARIRELIAQRVATDEEAEPLDGPIAFHTEEVPQPCKDGTVVVTEVTTSFRRNPRTGRIEIHGVTRDITERKRAEAERSRLEAQLQQAQRMESVGRLAGGVAHDFNNMLGVILGHAELALELAAPGHPIQESLEAIQAAATRSASLTRQLLAFARKQTITPRELDLNDAVEGTLRMLQRLIGEDVRLDWRPTPSRWPIRLDPSQLDQILTNLCVNARDAISDVGSITIATGTRVIDAACGDTPADATPGEYAWLSVRDDGCGMTPETLAHLFEPFFTTKPVGKGTGLGLATVYGIVRQNHGFVEVASAPGQGTTITVLLPRAPNRSATLPEEPAAEGGPGRETILLVEDEPAIRKLTEKMLERLGYTVLASGSPGEALAVARTYRGRIHLLLTDVVMPEMNGRDLAARLLERFPNLRRLFMSGYPAEVIAHRGVLEEGVSFLQKPFTLNGLALKVREALGGG
jgi:PAS domain S-box-containing protein